MKGGASGDKSFPGQFLSLIGRTPVVRSQSSGLNDADHCEINTSRSTDTQK